MFGLGSQELLVILVIVLILFGGRRLPDLARSLGSSIREFKKGVDEGKSESDAAPAVCRSCGGALATDWSHCPRCGTAVVERRLAAPDPARSGETATGSDRDVRVGPKNGAARDV